LLREFNNEQQRAAVFSPNGQYIASRGFGDAFLWDVSSAEPDITIPGRVEVKSKLSDVLFSPDGSLLAYLDTSNGYKLILWDVNSRKIHKQFSIPDSLDTSFAFSPDGKLIAIAICTKSSENYPCTEGQVILIDIASGKVTRQFTGDGGAVAFDPEGKFLAASAFGRLALWDIASQQNLFSVPEHTERTGFLAFNPNGSLLISGGRRVGENLAFWDPISGKLLATHSHGGYVSSVAFRHDGRLMAVAASDGLFLLGLP
jgi:WD40 repeat protein